MTGFWQVANVVTFGVNTLLTFTVGTAPRSDDNADPAETNFVKKLLAPDGSSNSEISAKYPTLVTPSGWAFSIWGIIFLSEGASVVWQLFTPVNVQIELEPAAPYLSGAFLLQVGRSVALLNVCLLYTSPSPRDRG